MIIDYIKLSDTEIKIPRICLGTWAFSNDKWWGYQDDRRSLDVINACVDKGLNFIDTAPAYGRGHSEKLIGSYIQKNNYRDKVILATKLGLKWEGRYVSHDLSAQRMQQEFDDSRRRLNTDYFDIYQVHWPDPDTAPEAVAEIMYKWYQKGYIKAIGVSNFSVEEMKRFSKYAPLHSLQPPYNMFRRDIEHDILDYCFKKNISVLAYSTLHNGVLTGKFFKDSAKQPKDLVRKYNKDLQPDRQKISKDTIAALELIAKRKSISMTQLSIAWLLSRNGLSSAIVGIRTIEQLTENIVALDVKMSKEDDQDISNILGKRDKLIRDLELVDG